MSCFDRLRVLSIPLAALGGLYACGTDDPGTAIDAADAATTVVDAATASLDAATAPPDAAPDAAPILDASRDAGPMVTIHGTAYVDKRATPGKAAVAIVQLADGSASTTTDADGHYTLDVPAHGTMVLRVLGQLSGQRLLVDPSGDVAIDLHAIEIDSYVGSTFHVGGTVTTHSPIAVRFVGSTVAGYAAVPGAAYGGSYVYAGANHLETQSATTQAAGDTLFLYEVTPGTSTVSFPSPAGLGACHDPMAPEGAAYPVDDNTITEIVLQCP